MKCKHKQFLLLLFLLTVSYQVAAQCQEMKKDKTYNYVKSGNKYIVSIKNHSELLETLAQFCADQGIKSGTVSGLGGVEEATLRFANPTTKKYTDKTLYEQLLITNLTGNISQLDGKPYLHIHAILARPDYSVLTGCLTSALVNGSSELVIEELDVELNRQFCSEIGLNVYDFH